MKNYLLLSIYLVFSLSLLAACGHTVVLTSPTSKIALTPTVYPTRILETPTATPDIAAKVVSIQQPKLYASYPSPDGKWRIDVVIYNCVKTVGVDENAYEQLKLINVSSGDEVTADDQLQYCGGMGAFGLAGLFWSPDSHSFYYTDAREGVPDGCGYWERPIIRLDVISLDKEYIGAGLRSPDEGKIASWQGRELVVLNINGSVIARAPAIAEAEMGPLAWSPDSQGLIYLQFSSYCPLSGKSYVVYLDLLTHRQTLLLESENPTFGEVSWNVPDKIALSDEKGQQWIYGFTKFNQMPSLNLLPHAFPGPLIHEQAGPMYETVIQIPVEEGGIQYRGAGIEDMEPVGPNGLVVTPDGIFIIGDVFGNRLLRYDAAGNRLDDIDLTPLGILNISDLVSAGNALYILEISFKVLPERYRVNQLTTDGELVKQYDLPEGFHFEDGLYGLAIGYPAEGEVIPLIELRPAGSRYYKLPDLPQSLPEELPALPIFGKELSQQSAGPGELAFLGAGEQEFTSQMTAGGTISLLSAMPNGSMYLQREDMVAWDPVITTDLTIHYVSAGGLPVGVARYPLKDWYFHLWRFLTVGPDGNVYALITREKSVDVLRLNFYTDLEPILPGAFAPDISRIALDPSPKPTYDCSQIKHILPDSSEAQHIVQEFITNFHQDWPTEYMAFEQLWSIDQLGEYAVIQGLVTQEESDILVVHETSRGFVMVARYTSTMLLPGLAHSDISEYFVTQLPYATPELFYCLDMNKFTGREE